ncbi:M23 family metallopeptidase [Phytoactinopolyspora halotolerans]|uniref:Peptidoglycan DD-metalloendopeptidase family protein n=1 Tax=Phytoactinopolyspora halotolerans TaxID=1981512 RepID=A0A6L9S9U4_9ACTN|nr:M23 family metallopeptidase [Phytoactinopolyspora halotolerans]NEE01298.1 peptidoglycan DD-metalloendopeptidase family protein [Phytoactinopolyspora halotolerans]
MRAVVAAGAGLVLVTAGMPAHAEPASPIGSTAVVMSNTTPSPDSPTSPPAEPPSGDPDDYERTDPGDAYDQALADAQTVAVAEAQELLQSVLHEVDEASASLDRARAAADSARSAEQDARREVKVAEEAIQRTEREMNEIEASTEDAKAALGSVAREAYQNNGLATVSVVLGAESPQELTDRYNDMRTILNAGDDALGRLASQQADLRNASATLEAQRQDKERLAEQAEERRAEAEQAETAAEEARAEHADKQEQVEKALELAEDAKLEDYERYMEQMDEATAVTELLQNLPDPEPDPPRDGGGSADRDRDRSDDGSGDGDTDDGGGGSAEGTGSFALPGNGSVTSEYGPRMHPILGYVKIHTGIDFSAGDGNIYAADSGTVVEATFNTAYGNMVIVDHGVSNGQRISTLYAHQSGLSVSVGQQVAKGQVIGQIGSTGYSTGPHLHFEVRINGEHTNPRPYLPL